ncbi:flagellar filament capping protein FliD [Thauera sinica]|uniref:Flagellar hook-associated protein 2 n=1 Tax=Thauera sinica TaxID=2665146 RepID=A0ABW1ANX5_9RHOO|nr:flagellar filament capping protein FliD [Thauera sp. K11]ATE59436.1 flagellar hook-associated protein [Thauera sp. K11]
MAISAAGVGSGLDVSGIISQLMAVERQPLTRIESQQSSYQSKLSAFGLLKSAMSKLQDAAATLAKPGTFSATAASAGDTKAFTVSSTSSAQTGSYNVEVSALARTQRVATSATAEPAVGEGSLTISLGRYAEDGSFTPAEDGEKTISLAAGATLADLRKAINAADAGVSAQIVNNGTVNQLVISSKETGAANAFRLSGDGALAGFGFDAGNPSGSSLTSVQQAQDARLTIDGLAITRSTNTVTDAIEGVTLKLAKLTDEETAVTVTRDDTVATKAIDDFVKAYNELNTLIRSQTSYNAETKKAGTLNGDSGVRSIQNQIRGVFSNPLSGLSGATTLSQIGITFKTDGSISVDSTKLTEALADPAKKVGELFRGNGTVEGFAKTLESRIKSMLDTDGLLSARTEGISRSIKALDDRKETMELRLARIEARYSAQFTALDAAMSSMSTTSAYLTRQLASLSA